MAQPWILDYDPANCAVAATVSLIGEKWTFLVLREAFSGVRRFADIQRRTQAPRQILSDRLSRLVHEGLLRRVPYQEAGQRARHEYRLTAKGLDLYPIMVALMHFGDQYARARKARRWNWPAATAAPRSGCTWSATPATNWTRPARSPPAPAPAPAGSPDPSPVTKGHSSPLIPGALHSRRGPRQIVPPPARPSLARP